MKVTFLLDSLGAGGAERSTAVLLPRLRDLGLDIDVVTLRSAREGFEDDVRADGFDVTVLPVGGFVTRMRALRSVLRRTRTDVLHTALFASDQLGRLAAVGLPVAVVSSVVSEPRPLRSAPGGPAPWKVGIVNAVDAATGHLFVDRFHAVTPGVARLHAEAYRLKESRITVVERGRDPDVLGQREPQRRADVRRALGLGDDVPVVVTAGRHEAAKAHTDLVAAMDVVVARHPTAILLIAGRDGNASADLRAAIAARPGCAERVRLLGHRSDVADLLAAADVMALSSRVEGTAGVALEAMALGTPIASTRLAGMEGILVDGRNALLADVGDTQGLGAAITQLLDDPARAEALATEARADFLERFTLDRSAERMAALYRDVVGR